MQQHDKILNIFTSSTVKIKDLDKLKEYITFCIENDEEQRLLDEDGYSLTSHHHILPRADTLPFNDYTNLKSNSWNGTHLTYKNHYTAHHILVYALDTFATHEAFTKMNSTDVKKGRLKESDLIGADEFNRLMIERGRLHSEWHHKEIILEDGTVSTNTKETGKKISKTTTTPYTDENGIKTTLAKEQGKKSSKTKQSNTWWDNIKDSTMFKRNETIQNIIIFEGFKITIKEKNRINMKRTKLLKTKRFNLYNNKNELILENTIKQELDKISKALFKSTKENYLGKSINSKLNLNRLNKLHLIGYYVIEKPSFLKQGISIKIDELIELTEK